MLRKLLIIAGYLILAAFMVVTLAFSANEGRNIPCRSITIEFREDEPIKISKQEIARLVNAADDQLVGKNLSLINAETIEKEVEKHQAVLNAEVYKVIAKDSLSYSGILGVKVKHREPVLRVLSSSGRYYLDENGEHIPVSDHYTARVLTVTGYFNETFAREQVLPFVLFVDQSPFWKAQIEQIHVEKDGDVLLTPLVGDHLIELGPFEGFPKKLRNMKAFYQQVMVNNNWEKYKQVSVKYKNQVIAKKR